MSRDKHKRIIVSRSENFKLSETQYSGESIANRLLLQSGFDEGTTALVKLSRGKISIKFPNEIDKRLKKYGEHF